MNLSDYLPSIASDQKKTLQDAIVDLEDFQNTIKDYELSEKVVENDDKYNSLKTDILQTEPNKVGKVFEELNKFSNDEINNNHIDVICQDIKDTWVSKKDECSDTEYVSSDNSQDKLGSPACLVFSEWTDSAIDSRYPNCLATVTDFDKITDGIKYYVNELKGYAQSNAELLDELIETNVVIESKFNQTFVEIQEDLKEIKGVATTTILYIDYYFGDEGLLTNYFNCRKFHY